MKLLDIDYNSKFLLQTVGGLIRKVLLLINENKQINLINITWSWKAPVNIKHVWSKMYGSVTIAITEGTVTILAKVFW